ncbi:MAG TPA: (2Fe-2S)-binding protein [Thermoplasmata archaeon]|nr:(2Fe-2S)-binding protein [Thermoplasmata archaeon]
MGGPKTALRTGPTVELRVNGAPARFPRNPERSLLHVLRLELGLTGTKYGCGEGECGACTVLLDGHPVRSCQVQVVDLDGASVVTVEGLRQGGRLNEVQRAFAELGAFQCGFCTPGMVVSATALLRENPRPTDAEIRSALDGNVCRCCGYSRILAAVRRASELVDRSVPGST